MGMFRMVLSFLLCFIHFIIKAFDNLAIAVGLFASIMATWPPDSVFTYG